MTPNRVCLLAAAALAALLAAWFLRRTPAGDQVAADAGADRSRAVAAPAADASPSVSATNPAPPVPGPLHGLRRLPESLARTRGWAPPVPGADEENAAAAWKQLSEVRVSVDYRDTPLEDVCRDLLTRYRLDVRIDPLVPRDLVRVTFRVNDLAADQFLDLMTKMWEDPTLPAPQSIEDLMNRETDGLSVVTDEHGLYWIRRESQIRIVDDLRSAANRVRDRRRPEKTLEELRAAGLAGRTATVSLVRRPLQEVVDAALASAGVKCRGWNPDATDVAETAPGASLIGTELPLQEALEELLTPAGLALSFDENGAWLCTREQLADFSAERLAEIADFRELQRLEDALRKRTVRIEGDILRLRDVLAQLSVQLGVPAVAHPDIDQETVLWESDGMEQEAGEVLGILARDATLAWRFAEDGEVRGLWVWDRER